MSTANGTENGRTRVFVYGALVTIVAIAVVGVVFMKEQAISILGFCGLAVTGLFTHLSSVRTSQQQAEKQDQKLDVVAEKADVAAAKVEEVKTTLVKADAKNDEKLDGLAKDTKDIHTLVNSGRGVTLRLNAELSRWKADQTKKPEDNQAATLAEREWHEHNTQQAKVDAKAAKDEKPDAAKADTLQIEVTNLPRIEVADLPQKVEIEIVEKKGDI